VGNHPLEFDQFIVQSGRHEKIIIFFVDLVHLAKEFLASGEHKTGWIPE
jgi:hypothetical protein